MRRWQKRSRCLLHGTFSGVGTALVEFQSHDGLDWKPADPVLATKPKIAWQGDVNFPAVRRIERPQLYVENGMPTTLFVAVLDASGKAYNVPIPLSSE